MLHVHTRRLHVDKTKDRSYTLRSFVIYAELCRSHVGILSVYCRFNVGLTYQFVAHTL